MIKKILLILLIISSLYSCYNVKNDELFNKYLNIENKIRKNINYIIIYEMNSPGDLNNNYKEKLKYKIYEKVYCKYKLNDNNLEFIEGEVNGKIINKSHEVIKNHYDLLGLYRISFFNNEYIKTKIINTNKTRIINNEHYKAYKFIKKIKSDNYTYREIGVVSINIKTGLPYSLYYKTKLPFKKTYLIPGKSYTNQLFVFNNNKIQKIITDINMEINIFGNIQSNNIKIIESID